MTLTAQRCVCGMYRRTRSKEPCDAQVHGMLQWSMALACWSAFNVVCVQVLCYEVMRSCTAPRAVDEQTLCLLCRHLAPHAASGFPHTTADSSRSAHAVASWPVCSTASHLLSMLVHVQAAQVASARLACGHASGCRQRHRGMIADSKRTAYVKLSWLVCFFPSRVLGTLFHAGRCPGLAQLALARLACAHAYAEIVLRYVAIAPDCTFLRVCGCRCRRCCCHYRCCGLLVCTCHCANLSLCKFV